MTPLAIFQRDLIVVVAILTVVALHIAILGGSLLALLITFALSIILTVLCRDYVEHGGDAI